MSEINVKIPSFGAVLKNVYKEATKFSEEEIEEKEAKLNGMIGFVETPVGFYVLDDEGCGHLDPISDLDKIIELDFYVGFYNSGVFKITLGDLLELPIKKELPLHDFVRSFGSRLERNYEACRQEFEICSL